MATCLTLENLTWAAPGGRTLGRGLSLQLKRGEVLWIQGPNGSGKSTLIHTLLGDISPQAGRIALHFPNEKLGYLPQVQNRECHLPLTLSEVVALSGRDLKLAQEYPLLDSSRFSLAWNQASGGERQRTLLLRELIQKPELLVLDEPLNHLDEASKAQIQKVLLQLLHESQAPALILVSHGGIGIGSDLPLGGYHLQLHSDGTHALNPISLMPSAASLPGEEA
jgi:ABC-type Mn2+/Zn2+ transport system ATPase subunit